MRAMNPEHILIPYTPAALPAGSWLVFAPHADDETFGMGGSLIRAAEAGLHTEVVVVTDGALGKKQEQEAEQVALIRRREVEQAAAVLGVGGLHLWSEPDRGLRCTPELIERTRQLINSSAAASVFFPGALEPHPDHRMTAQLVWQALQGIEPALRPEAFSYDISVQSPCNLLLDITAQRERKRQAMAVYASQNALNAYPNLIEALNTTRTFTLSPAVTAAEAFYHYPREEGQQTLREVVEQALALYW